MKDSTLYIAIILTVFAAAAAILLCLPRSTYSILEKRELATFPDFSTDKLKNARYMEEVSKWFSDTEPYRDVLMNMSMAFHDAIRFHPGDDDEAISFHATDNNSNSKAAPGADLINIPEYQNHINAEENAKIASSGILIVGKAPNARALNAFGGSDAGGMEFAGVVNEYARELPGVKVYAMVIPLSSEFYTPDKAKNFSNPQLPFINNVYSHLSSGARGVNAYSPLAQHADENIYLRTDHHWAPLGAFYAAKAFAATAGVPFRELSSYDTKIVKNFVGSMYGYSKDIAIKNSPEDFIYYVPKGIATTTTYYDYTVNSDYHVTGEKPAVKGNFFYNFKDGNGNAYCTFMGSDQRLTHIHTSAATGRRLVIIKDSYGNPLPSFLFFAFDDIFVIDFRYFARNMKNFVKVNKITDLLFAVNVFNAYSGSAAAKMRKFLSQNDGNYAPATPQPATPEISAPKPNSTNTHPAETKNPANTESTNVLTAPADPHEASPDVNTDIKE